VPASNCGAVVHIFFEHGVSLLWQHFGNFCRGTDQPAKLAIGTSLDTSI